MELGFRTWAVPGFTSVFGFFTILPAVLLFSLGFVVTVAFVSIDPVFDLLVLSTTVLLLELVPGLWVFNLFVVLITFPIWFTTSVVLSPDLLLKWSVIHSSNYCNISVSNWCIRS